MAPLSEREPLEDDATVEIPQMFGLHDWLETVAEDGVDDMATGSALRLTRWYSPETQMRYHLTRAEMRDSDREAPYSQYYLQVFPDPDDRFVGFLYSSDIDTAFKCDGEWRVLGSGEPFYRQSEIEMLAHLQTVPADKWPRYASRLPDVWVQAIFAEMCAVEFGPQGLRPKASWQIADRLGRLGRRGWGPFRLSK